MPFALRTNAGVLTLAFSVFTVPLAAAGTLGALLLSLGAALLPTDTEVTAQLQTPFTCGTACTRPAHPNPALGGVRLSASTATAAFLGKTGL